MTPKKPAADSTPPPAPVPTSTSLPAGMQTSEFGVTALTIIAAVVLALTGKIDGTAAFAGITAATTGYTVSRGIAKKGNSADLAGR